MKASPRRTGGLGLAIAMLAGLAPPVFAAQAEPEAPATAVSRQAPVAATRNGREIYRRFREGLADPDCEVEASSRWSRHFAAAPKRLATRDETLALFGYVVDALREASLPTEYALIPFVESGYRPGAQSPSGPAGLWQMIRVTARNHHVPISHGFDGRLSPVESTRAAVRYLKTLHGMFAGDWRLAVMAYNAGEYRILRALKRGGQVARNAQPEKLPGLSSITYAYVRKLHALSCLMEQTGEREQWLVALDRPVPVLEAVTLPDDVQRIDAWARAHGQDAERLRRLNPAYPGGRIQHDKGHPARLLVVASAQAPMVGASTEGEPPAVASGTIEATATATDADAPASDPGPAATPPPAGATAPDPDTRTESATAPRRHTVARGDSLWKLARQYGVRLDELLRRNGLGREAVLRPGTVLLIDDAAP